MTFLIKIITVLFLCYLALSALVYFFADKIAFPAPKASYEFDESKNYVRLKIAGDETISGIWLEYPNAEHTILYSHGNGEDIGQIRDHLETIRRMGFNVMSYDYSGYGQSEGKPGADKVYPCAEAAWNFLVETKKTSPQNIVVWGYSMGSSAATWLAAKKNPRALILIGGFASAFHAMLPVNIFPWDMLNNERLIKDVKSPVMIIHGNRDIIVPYRNAKRLYKAANEPKKLYKIEGAGHYGISEIAQNLYYSGVRNFINTLNFPESN